MNRIMDLLAELEDALGSTYLQEFVIENESGQRYRLVDVQRPLDVPSLVLLVRPAQD